MDKLNVLVLGDGLLGSEIVKISGWDFISRRKDGIDISNINTFKSKLNEYDIILNCIAHTDTYSNDRQKHWDINYRFVHSLLLYCNENKKKLVHISTHYIYANSSTCPSENDVPVHQNSWYAYTKNLGDALVQLLSNNYLCIRCMHKPKPFPYDSAWIDQVGNFDYVDVIAKQIIELVNLDSKGVFNVGTGLKSMYDLAKQTNKNVQPILSPEKAPKWLQISLDKLEKEINGKTPFFSICIPAYGYNGNGVAFLEKNLSELYTQKFKDFEVIVSDHSIDDYIENLCLEWKDKLRIKYIRNEKGRGKISPNLNSAMQKAEGKWIKILFQDDFLFNEDSLQRHFDFIQANATIKWFATRFIHSHDAVNYYRDFMPRWSDNIWSGNNSLGCPSVICLHRNFLLYFDEDLNWLMDCDWYQRMFREYGLPGILNQITVVNRTNQDRLTNTISLEEKNKEYQKLKDIYA